MKINIDEKLNWIREHLRHGDQKKISELLPEGNYNDVVNVLKGRFVGEHGVLIIDVTKVFLEKRLRHEAQKIKKIREQMETEQSDTSTVNAKQ
jgi:hypothetical protein